MLASDHGFVNHSEVTVAELLRLLAPDVANGCDDALTARAPASADAEAWADQKFPEVITH